MIIFNPSFASIVMLSFPDLSFSVILPFGVLRTLVSGFPGMFFSAQKHPDQIGRFGLPFWNSTHTSAFTGGIKNRPTPFPAYGTHGRAHVESLSFNTSGTLTLIRPRDCGSSLSITAPGYFPQYCLSLAIPAPS